MSDKVTRIEELLCSESFLAWYFRTDASAIDHWEEWKGADPVNTELAARAVEFLSTLQISERPVTDRQRTQAIRRLLARLERQNNHSLHVRIPIRERWAIAAAVLLLVTGLYYFSSLPPRKNKWATGYGEVKKNFLPDGTEILANANTSITYANNWVDGRDREVWLKGEAFFHVRKTDPVSRFIVHLENVDIIVTGTRFNAVNRPDRSNILLSEGSVSLSQRGHEGIKMAPGDFVELVGGQLMKRAVKTDSCLDWKDRRMYLYNTPLSELAKSIREQYGVGVELVDLPGEKLGLTGILANDNLDVLLKAIETTGDVRIIRDKDKIIIKEH